MKPSIDLKNWPEDASWKRLKLERDNSWIAFFTYLGMPVGERSVLGAYRLFSGRSDVRTPPDKWYSWSKHFHWQDRVVEYERWKSLQGQVEEERKHAEETERWDAIRLQERENGLKIGQALLEKAQAMLRFPLAEVERVVAVYDDGREKEVQIFKPAGWNFGTVARMIEVGSKLVQLMAQMATEHHKIDLGMIYDEAEKVAKQIGGGATREDVLAMADRIVQERQERLDEEGRG